VTGVERPDRPAQGGDEQPERELTLASILADGRRRWPERMSPAEIVVALGVVFGDLCRHQRELDESGLFNLGEFSRELGNLVLSGVRWIDDLELSVETTLKRAAESQDRYVAPAAEPEVPAVDTSCSICRGDHDEYNCPTQPGSRRSTPEVPAEQEGELDEAERTPHRCEYVNLSKRYGALVEQLKALNDALTADNFDLSAELDRLRAQCAAALALADELAQRPCWPCECCADATRRIRFALGETDDEES
jgi:hypothetical protein